MTTSRVMETRRRFREIYGGPEDYDYGSMENLANAHRDYLRRVKEAQQQQQRTENQQRQMDAFQWVRISKIKSSNNNKSTTPNNTNCMNKKRIYEVIIAISGQNVLTT